MKKFMYFMLTSLIALLIIASANSLLQIKHTTPANAQIIEDNYVVYDEENNFLFERIIVKVGDEYIDKSFNKYQVYMVNEIKKEARAKFIETLPKPNLTKTDQDTVDNREVNKKIALYMTHNAESYIIGDGTDSYYGKGGVHDVAKSLANNLQKKGVEVFINETLHLPHDVNAYARSRKTATDLMKQRPNALFDIHRDGASRRTYAKTTNGKEHSTVRIVVGQANPYKDKNLQFALYLLSVAEVDYPWLFLDIYHAKGHYNQELYEKALLFEMGTYTIEKDLVMETIAPLSQVIYTTLYSTTVNESTGDLTIGGSHTEKQPTINELLAVEGSNSGFGRQSFIATLAFLTLTGFGLVITIKYFKNNKITLKKLN